MRHTTTFVLIAVIVGFGTWGIFAWRARTNARTQNTLCEVIYTIIRESDQSLGTPGAPGFRYYQDHPEELRFAHRANRHTLEQLPCRS